MRTYKHTAYTVLDRYIVRRTQKRRRRRFRSSAPILRLIWIPFLHKVLNVFVRESRNYVVISVVQKVMEFEEIG